MGEHLPLSDSLQTPATLRIEEEFSVALIMWSATPARKILKSKRGR
jgi:hypothetical protein